MNNDFFSLNIQISFNEVRDLAALQFHLTLQVLDLEANLIDDIQEVKNLSYCPKLIELTVEDNPITKKSSCLWEIKCALPQLEILDSQPVLANYITNLSNK